MAACKALMAPRTPFLRLSITLALLLLLAGPVVGLENGDTQDNWPQWRGPSANGVASSGSPPVEWGESKNVRWKVDLPGLGSSTPVVWGDRVFVTSAIDTGKPGPRAAAPSASGSGGSGRPGGRRGHGSAAPASVYQFVVLAYDRADGSLLWQRVVREAQPHEGTHPDGTYASGSPITDGEKVFAFFGSFGVYALDMDGKLLWERDLGDMRARLGFGEGGSPALHGNALVVAWDHEDDSFIVALDKNTGNELWRVARQEATSWTTPLIVEHAGSAQVIVSATSRVRSYDLATGELIWETSGMTFNTIPSPVHRDGVVYLMSGFRGNSLMAIRLVGARGDIEGSEHVVWTLDRDTPYVPSPLLYDDTLYFLKSNSGVLSAVDASSGEAHYGPTRLGSVRNVYASPVGAAGRVYLVGRDGQAIVIRHGAEFDVLAENSLDDAFDASPAIVGDEMFLRGRRSLYCLAAD